MNRILCSVVLALCFLTANSFAGGPIYSRFGIGDLAYVGGSRSYALGGASAGLYGDGFINQINPAGLAGISMTRFSGSFEFSNYSSTDGINSARYARGDFGGLSIAMPLSKEYGVTIFGEMSPYTAVNYALHRSDSQLGINSTQQYFGSGGILRFDVGSSVSITNTLHAGFKANYLAGTILHNTKIEFQDNSYGNSELDRRFFYSGFMVTFGAMYEGLSDLLNVADLKPLVLGAVVETPTTLNVRQQNFNATGQDYDTTLTQTGTADVPLFVALGASYTFSQRYVLSADLAMQNWSNAKNFGVHPPEYRNRTRIGAGFEILPSKDASTYWGHIIYRAGFYYNSTYLQVNSQSINGIFGTAGVGLPIAADSHLDIGLQIGVNGTTSNNLQKDTIIRLSVSVSGSELWFMRYEED
jgi:hypothetical protein